MGWEGHGEPTSVARDVVEFDGRDQLLTGYEGLVDNMFGHGLRGAQLQEFALHFGYDHDQLRDDRK